MTQEPTPESNSPPMYRDGEGPPTDVPSGTAASPDVATTDAKSDREWGNLLARQTRNERAIQLRNRTFRRSLWLLALLPWLTAFVSRLSLGMLFVGNPFVSLLAPIAVELEGAVSGVIVVQILVWWQWSSHGRGKWLRAVLMLLTFQVSQMVIHIVSGSYYVLNDDRWLLIGLLLMMSSVSIAIHYIALAVSGSIIQFRWVDETVAPPVPQEMGANREQADVVHRTPWTIRGMFAATLVAAVTLSSLRILRAYYVDRGVTDYPAVDFGYIAWFISVAIGNVLCLVAAANRSCGGKWPGVLLLLALSILSVWAGIWIWAWTFAEGGTASSGEGYRGTAIDVLLMFVIHLLVLRRWAARGYRLARSEPWSLSAR